MLAEDWKGTIDRKKSCREGADEHQLIDIKEFQF